MGGGGLGRFGDAGNGAFFSGKGPSSPKSVKKIVCLRLTFFFQNWFWAAGNSSGFGMQLCSRVVLSYVGTEGFVCSLFLHSFCLW